MQKCVRNPSGIRSPVLARIASLDSDNEHGNEYGYLRIGLDSAQVLTAVPPTRFTRLESSCPVCEWGEFDDFDYFEDCGILEQFFWGVVGRGVFPGEYFRIVQAELTKGPPLWQQNSTSFAERLRSAGAHAVREIYGGVYSFPFMMSGVVHGELVIVGGNAGPLQAEPIETVVRRGTDCIRFSGDALFQLESGDAVFVLDPENTNAKDKMVLLAGHQPHEVLSRLASGGILVLID